MKFTSVARLLCGYYRCSQENFWSNFLLKDSRANLFFETEMRLNDPARAVSLRYVSQIQSKLHSSLKGLPRLQMALNAKCNSNGSISPTFAVRTTGAMGAEDIQVVEL